MTLSLAKAKKNYNLYLLLCRSVELSLTVRKLNRPTICTTASRLIGNTTVKN